MRGLPASREGRTNEGAATGSALRQRPPSFAARLATFGSSPALVGPGIPGGRLSYAELASRVDEFAESLGPKRSLVLAGGDHGVDSLVAYLGALAGGHPVMLVGSPTLDALVSAYDPDVVAGDGSLTIRHRTPAHDLHADLAALLSTSGTTGSPKLVRLSADNLAANATAIAEYLHVSDRDVAATTLPMHYCYGLSVVNSHLSVGAALLLTDRSVVEPAFWDDFRSFGATSFAGVPYTFDLLDRSGFADLDLPSLRYVTQAGGRLTPDRVRSFAELGQRRGFDFFVMYGQTEATARMAYLPPSLAITAPSAIGVPIPGGSFTIEPLPESPGTHQALDPGVGELVYHGRNVMLGYAESPADLALGRTVGSLHTGDLGRQRPDGLYEIVGRRSRIAKVFGLRLDLDHVERVLASRDVMVTAVDGGDRLVLAVCSGARPVDSAAVLALAIQALGLPASALRILVVAELPRLASGKTDFRALLALHRAVPTDPVEVDSDAPAAVLRLVGSLLSRPDVRPTDTFVTLGGDSLSYVEVSLHLERLLGHLPPDWHTTPLEDLAHSPVPPRHGSLVEMNVLLRAVAIVCIVSTHANLFSVLGGAHLLIGIVGFNYGRFHVSAVSRRQRLGSTLRSVARLAIPSALVIGTFALWTDGLGWRQSLLVNSLTSRRWSEPAWHYWFIEAILHIVLLVALLMAVPMVDRAERRWPFWLPFCLAVAALPSRFEMGASGAEIHRGYVLLWLFAIGWATAKASSRVHRISLSLLILATVPGFTSEPARDAYVVLGLLALVWVRHVRIPRHAAGVLAELAAASLWIYLVHWQVYPILEDRSPALATLLGLAAGVLAWRAASLATATPLRHRLGRRRDTATAE